MSTTELFSLCEKQGLTVYRQKHALGAGKLIIANRDDEVVWDGQSVTDALDWVYEQMFAPK